MDGSIRIDEIYEEDALPQSGDPVLGKGGTRLEEPFSLGITHKVATDGVENQGMCN